MYGITYDVSVLVVIYYICIVCSKSHQQYVASKRTPEVGIATGRFRGGFT